MHSYIKKFQVLIARFPVSVTQQISTEASKFAAAVILAQLALCDLSQLALCYRVLFFHGHHFWLILESDKLTHLHQELAVAMLLTEKQYLAPDHSIHLKQTFYPEVFEYLWLKFRVWQFLPNSSYSMTLLRSHGFIASSFLHCFVFNEIIRNWI